MVLCGSKNCITFKTTFLTILAYVIVNSIALLVYIAIAYGLSKAKV